MSKKRKNKLDKALLAKLQEKVNPEFQAFLQQELPRAESLHQRAPKDDRVTRPLTKMYWSLNRHLGIVCEHLGYSLREWEWDQSEPLEVLAQFHQGLEATTWYQLHLSQMLMPVPNHPWLKIMT